MQPINKSDNDKIFEAMFPKGKTEVIEGDGIIGMVYVPDGTPGKLDKPRNITITDDPSKKKEFKTISRIVISYG